MKKNEESLFRIGEVTKILGISRKTLLVFENMGLLTPAVKDEESGYRYYTADNMTQIRSIRSLQSLGLTLKEVKEYYYDADNLDAHLERLMELRATLDRNIQMLQARSAKHGDLTVRRTTLPRQVCFCRRDPYESVTAAAAHLRDTYITAARTGHMSNLYRMFTMRLTPPDGEPQLLCCIPMNEAFDGPERTVFEETTALCIYYRGSYADIGTAFQALAAHLKANHIEAVGPMRSIYLEGPPNRGTHTEDYVTQVAVPIKE